MNSLFVEALANQLDRHRVKPNEELELPYIADDFNLSLADSIDELFNVDLNLKEHRIRLAARHVMLGQRYTVPTQTIEHFHDLAYDWAIARKSGLYVIGLHRQGKTTALESSIASLEEELPFIAFLSCNGQRLTNKTKEAFCRYLLESWGHPTNRVNRGSRPETVLANYIMVRCAEAGGNQCVLFIDEAQLFSVAHYRYLLELWNTLRSQGFILCTILVGQPDLIQLRAITDELDHGAVVSRFFVKGHTLTGMKSKDMLEKFLKNYDANLYYPLNSEWSYSRFFAKEAFEAGWRLEDEAAHFWSALCNLSEAKPKVIKTSGFRLAWIVDAIHGFLLDAMANDKSTFHGTVPLWQELLEQSTDTNLIV